MLFKPVIPVLEYIVFYDYFKNELCENKEKVELKGFIYIKEMLVPSKIDLIDANLVEKVEE